MEDLNPVVTNGIHFFSKPAAIVTTNMQAVFNPSENGIQTITCTNFEHFKAVLESAIENDRVVVKCCVSEACQYGFVIVGSRGHVMRHYVLSADLARSEDVIACFHNVYEPLT